MAFNDLFEGGAEEQEVVAVEVVTLAGKTDFEVVAGTTVAEFKTANGLTGSIADGDGTVLANSDVIEDDMTLFVVAAKQNGKRK